MIDWVLRRIAARYWRWRVARNEEREATWTAEFMEWKRENPDRCMYCAYTRWARDEQGVKLKLEPHDCAEGKSPPHPLPTAKVHS